ncbi:MAG: hypothetical protein ACLQIQ_19875 [Beijerinckiaceae bacterium]
MSLTVCHRLMKRGNKAIYRSHPEIGYSNYVEEHEPSLRLPDAPPQSSNQMGLARARLPHNYPADWVVCDIPRVQKEIVHDPVDSRIIQLVDLKNRIGPDAL